MKKLNLIIKKYFSLILLLYLVTLIFSWIYEEKRIVELEHTISKYKLVMSLPDSVSGTCMRCSTPYVQYLYPDSFFTKHKPNFSKMNIIDYQQLHKDFPQTFEVPTQQALDNITKGDLVKICVDNERFWVRVETIQDEKVTGHIYSDLIHTSHGLKANDHIEFEKKNVYKINL